MVLRQMAEMARLPAYEMLTWKKLFTAIIEYCIRWAHLLAEVTGVTRQPSFISAYVHSVALPHLYVAE